MSTPSLSPVTALDASRRERESFHALFNPKTVAVIGATDKDGIKVTERPVSVPDLFCSFCQVLGLNPHDEYKTTDNRPLKLVEGGKVVTELFS